jgi:hypothetical protein
MNSCRQRRAKVACVQPTFTSLPRPLAAFLNMSQAPLPRPQREDPSPRHRVGSWSPVILVKVGPSLAAGDICYRRFCW